MNKKMLAYLWTQIKNKKLALLSLIILIVFNLC